MPVFIPHNGLPLALPGAITPTRWVGGTAGGAPVAGTFAVGDWVTDVTGQMFICTVAGTPGTWINPLAAELAYAEQTVAQNTNSAVNVDFAGLNINPVIGTRPIELELIIPTCYNTTTANTFLQAYIIDVTGGGNAVAGNFQNLQIGAAQSQTIRCFARVAPGAGARNYKAQWNVSGGTVQANLSGAPYFIYATLRCKQV